MSITVTETVLEMHYHRHIMDLVRDTLGLGTKSGLNFYKYSTAKEAFVGFDQAYVRTDLSEKEFFDVLKTAAMNNGYQLDKKYVGFFLQFKVVHEMRKTTKHTPATVTNRPYYRVSLDTTKNINTGVSQHELLFNLNTNIGALVFYACPMLFDRADLYEVDVDLSTLRLADMNSCPSVYTDNDHHFIFYDDQQAAPVWCSEPVEGRAIDSRQFAQELAERVHEIDASESAAILLKTLTALDIPGVRAESEFMSRRGTPSILPLVGDAITIIEIPVDDRRSA